jgi:hypothetical protein
VEHYSGHGAKADFMKNQKQTLPPRWAQRLLEWYCRPELLEDLQGDLNEYFERHCQTKGTRKAKLIYVSDVIKFFSPTPYANLISLIFNPLDYAWQLRKNIESQYCTQQTIFRY